MTQYDVELVQRIETMTGKKMELWPTEKEEVAMMRERVDEAGRVAAGEMKDMAGRGGTGGKKRRRDESGGKADRDRDDDVVEAGMPTTKKRFKRRR